MNSPIDLPVGHQVDCVKNLSSEAFSACQRGMKRTLPENTGIIAEGPLKLEGLALKCPTKFTKHGIGVL